MGEHEHGSVLVTGAGSGIGAATARTLAGTGRLVLLAGRRLEALEAVAGEIENDGGRAKAVECDIRNLEAVQSAAGQSGWIEILVNAAGVMPIGPIPDADPSDWKRILDVNILGALHAIDTVLPGMLEHGRGHVVNIGSIAGHKLFPDATVYCASKAALHVINDGLRAELAQRRRDDGNRIRVTLVAPGAVDTDLPASITHEPTREATRSWYERMEGILRPEDVAETVRWAIESPEHVSINEVVVRPTEMVR